MLGAIFGPELLILLFLVVPAFGIWTAIDAGTKPAWAFDRAGQNKTLWVVVPILGIFFCGIVTIIAAIMWLSSVRARVIAASSSVAPAPQPGAQLPPGPQWGPDPLGRHELRYWNGSQWTEHVSDAGVSSTDPIDPRP